MPKKVQLKSAQSNASVADYLNSIEPARARKQARALAKLFKTVTGAKPKMWGTSIVGYGKYKYYRANGDEGDYLATGFSMRKSGPVLYIMPGYRDYAKLLARLGPHRLGKSCLYLKNLDEVNQDVIAELIQAGLKDLSQTHEVKI